MAEVTEGLASSGAEQSADIYSGELSTEANEQPEGNGSQSSEQPTPEVAVQSAGESEDSELGDLFADLEKDIPEGLRPQADSVKRKFQGYFTKKNQKIAQEMEVLRQNQLSDEARQEVHRLATWADRLQKDPYNGIKELASQLGVGPDDLLRSWKAQAGDPELDPSQLVTREDYVKFTRQEAKRLADEIRAKEVKPLQDVLTQLKGESERRANTERGSQILEEAKKSLPGFVGKDGTPTREAHEAIARVLRGEFSGPNGLKNAYFAVIGQQAPTKVQELEQQLLSLKKMAKGATSTPDGHSPKTNYTPSRPDALWDDLRSEPLSSG